MSTVALPQQAAAHEARYEQLREAGTNPQVMASRDGMAVVVQHGLAAWMQLCAKLPAPRPPRSQAPASAITLPEAACVPVVRVLSAMALGHLQEASA